MIAKKHCLWIWLQTNVAFEFHCKENVAFEFYCKENVASEFDCKEKVATEFDCIENVATEFDCKENIATEFDCKEILATARVQKKPHNCLKTDANKVIEENVAKIKIAWASVNLKLLC